MTHLKLLLAVPIMFLSCNNAKDDYDATGTFEAVEIIVSSETSGSIKKLKIEEGQTIEKNIVVGYIDSTQLFLKKKQLLAQIKAISSRSPNVPLQLAAAEEQLKQAVNERNRILKLNKEGAATQKQVDDVNTQVNVFEKQLEASRSTLGISVNGINEETMPLAIQIEQLNDQLMKCRIMNPLKGTILTKYAEENEMTTIGKPLYKIADLSEITLRAYITGDQLAQVKTGQQVTVFADKTKDQSKSYPGILQWVSDKAEFTPKTIQTKDERANLVYAIKIKVKNDGYLKIGMYGEIKF